MPSTRSNQTDSVANQKLFERVDGEPSTLHAGASGNKKGQFALRELPFFYDEGLYQALRIGIARSEAAMASRIGLARSWLSQGVGRCARPSGRLASAQVCSQFT